MNSAIHQFNRALFNLVQLVSNRLLSGDLGLIDDHSLNHRYLEKNWTKSSQEKIEEATHCQVVKKFSSLFSHLNVTKPDKVLIQKMAEELSNVETSFKSCQTSMDDGPTEMTLFQFNVKFNKDSIIDGFRFWYSLKVYLSWAFRFSSEIKEFMKPYDFIFRNVDLEEMILFFSNGCKSISAPVCSSHELNLNQLKLFSEDSTTFDLSSFDGTKPIPEGPLSELTSKPLPLREDDLLNLGGEVSASDWVSNFRENFLKVRGVQKLQLTKAMSQVFLLNTAKTPDELEKNISEEIHFYGEEFKTDLYYLC